MLKCHEKADTRWERVDIKFCVDVKFHVKAQFWEDRNFCVVSFVGKLKKNCIMVASLTWITCNFVMTSGTSERLVLHGTLFWCKVLCQSRVLHDWMEIRFLKAFIRILFGINYNQYLSVSLGSLSDITIHVIMCSIQCSLLLTGFTPQIATKKQLRIVIKSHWLEISRIAGQVRKIENPKTLPQERF